MSVHQIGYDLHRMFKTNLTTSHGLMNLIKKIFSGTITAEGKGDQKRYIVTPGEFKSQNSIEQNADILASHILDGLFSYNFKLRYMLPILGDTEKVSPQLKNYVFWEALVKNLKTSLSRMESRTSLI